MSKKIMYMITGTGAPLIGSNQSFSNTLEGYLNDGWEVYQFGFIYKNNPDYEINKLIGKYKNYHYYGSSKLMYKLTGIMKNRKNNVKPQECPKLPEPNEIIKPDNDIRKIHSLFFTYYNITETVRTVFFSLFRKPDIIYSYEFNASYPGHNLSKIIKKPHIKRYQGTFLDPDNPYDSKMWFHRKAYTLSADLTVMANDGTKGNIVLEKLGTPKEKILFLMNGIDKKLTQKVNPEEAKELKKQYGIENSYVMGIFNRMYPFKRVDRALYLLKKIKEENIKDVRLIIGGLGGPMESAIKEYAKANGLEENIIWAGKIKYEKMPLYYEICDLILIFNDCANTGNQVIESAYLGKNAIATDDGNNSEYLGYENIKYIKPENFSEESLRAFMKIYNERKKYPVNEKIMTWEERIKKEVDIVNKIKEKN